MKTKMFLFFMLSSCLLFFVSCGSEDLSRSKAEELIIKKHKFPKFVVEQLRLWDVVFDMSTMEGKKKREMFLKMTNEGLVSMERLTTNNISLASLERYKIILTDKGHKYGMGRDDLIEKPDGFVIDLLRQKIALLIVYEHKFGKITGIKKLDNNTREVNYTLDNVNFTPFRQYLCPTTLPIETAVDRFILYDDGWRIE